MKSHPSSSKNSIQATPAVLKKLEKMGLYTAFDLLLHKPLRYEDQTIVHPIKHAVLKQTVLVEGVITFSKVQYQPRRMLIVRIADNDASLVLRFMHFYPSQQHALKLGQRIRAVGEIRHGFLGKEMVHPKLQAVSDNAPLATTLTPVYPTVSGLTQNTLSRLINKAIETVPLEDTLPDSLHKKYGLVSFDAAIKQLHHPSPSPFCLTDEPLFDAYQRLKFDELLAQQLSAQLTRKKRQALKTLSIQGDGHLRKKLLSILSFALTPAQQRTLQEIITDLSCTKPMQRLLQGDVGSGKTIVATLAALAVIETGFQVALMVPTEILAEQHYFKIKSWFDALGLTTVCLVGSLTKKQKACVTEQIKEGASFIIGTHALFQDMVSFARLGLIIIDEQHRFGVMQRLALYDKGNHIHQLMMSATPIPRTLAMELFAELDVSSIDELPLGRLPIRTKLINATRRDEITALVKQTCQKGQQVYWVCPLIEESENLQLKTANETYQTLTTEYAPLAVGLMHGKMPAAARSSVIQGFVNNTIQVLVATTVIEVGVDIPNASLMIIEHAERMGLAQLHQLRGRIGRGTSQSMCVLLYKAPLSELATQRLKIIFENNDGFKIALEDFRLRGSGELFGQRQSGLSLLRFADLEKDGDLLKTAHAEAPSLLSSHPKLAKAHVARWLSGREQFLKT